MNILKRNICNVWKIKIIKDNECIQKIMSFKDIYNLLFFNNEDIDIEVLKIMTKIYINKQSYKDEKIYYGIPEKILDPLLYQEQ